jgi:hypothetical protein
VISTTKAEAGRMITVELTEAEARAISTVIWGNTGLNEEVLRTANDKLTDALDAHEDASTATAKLS